MKSRDFQPEELTKEAFKKLIPRMIWSEHKGIMASKELWKIFGEDARVQVPMREAVLELEKEGTIYVAGNPYGFGLFQSVFVGKSKPF